MKFNLQNLVQDLDFNKEYSERIALDGGDATLYLATSRVKLEFNDKIIWQTMPDILRAMPKDKRRLPYLKVFQYLQGVLTQDLDAVEVPEDS